MKKSLFWGLLFLLVHSYGCATGPPRSDFGEADTNADGFVTWTEYKAYHPRSRREIFLKTDGDHDERLDLNEWRTGMGCSF